MSNIPKAGALSNKVDSLRKFVPSLPRGWSGTWNHDRFIAACHVRKIYTAADLANAINNHRETYGDDDAITSRAARRYIKDERDPLLCGTGRRPACFELAEVLDVSLDWLTTDGEP